MKQPLCPVKSLSLDRSRKGSKDSKYLVGDQISRHGNWNDMVFKALPTQTFLGFHKKEAKVQRKDKG